MRVALRHALLLCTLLACGTSCAAQRPVGPETTLADFAAALERGDLQRAYELLSADARKRWTREQFERQVRDNPKETRALISALHRPAAPVLVARTALPDGPTAELSRAPDGSWRIDSVLTDFYGQDTPREALESFVRAVENARWDVVYGLMPEADRAGLDVETLAKNLEAQVEELTRLVALLKTSLQSPIEIVGDRATMPYGESYTARFVRENGRWKLEDPE
jgi:hypothetical protein